MLLARQVMFIGPSGAVRDAVHERLMQLGLRPFAEQDVGRAIALLRTTKRLTMLIVDNRDGAFTLEELPSRDDVPVLMLGGAQVKAANVTEVRDAESPEGVVRQVETALERHIFPPPFIEAVREATQSTFTEQFGAKINFQGVRLRGDAETLGEASAGIAFTSAPFVGHLGVFATAVMIEEQQRLAHGVVGKASDIILELTNLIAGRLRTIMLRHTNEFTCRLPRAWEAEAAAKQMTPAVVLQFERGSGERVHVDLRLARGDAAIFGDKRDSEALAPGDVRFLE